MLLPDIQEVKCFEFTVQMLPPPLGASLGAKKIIVRFANILPPPHRLISVYALISDKVFKRGLKKTLDILSGVEGNLEYLNGG